jgi:hypothetical protein
MSKVIFDKVSNLTERCDVIDAALQVFTSAFYLIPRGGVVVYRMHKRMLSDAVLV